MTEEKSQTQGYADLIRDRKNFDRINVPVSVAGRRLETTLNEFENSCLVLIAEEQDKPNPNNALISVLCNAVRLGREQADSFGDFSKENRYFILVLDGDVPEGEQMPYRLLKHDVYQKSPYTADNIDEAIDKASKIRELQPWRKAVVLKQVDP